MGPLSALEQFLCSGLAVRTRKHTAHTRTCTSIFSRFCSHPRGWGGRSGVKEGADNSELRTRQLRLLAEVLHLINGFRLHCALNHAQIKKLVIFKITGERGQLFIHFQSRWKPTKWSPPGFVTTPRLMSSLPVLLFPSLLPPQWRCSSWSLSFTSIIYSAFRHYLLLLFHLFQTPLSYQLSSQSPFTHSDFHSYHIYIKSIMHLRRWIIQATTWSRRGWFIFKTDT